MILAWVACDLALVEPEPAPEPEVLVEEEPSPRCDEPGAPTGTCPAAELRCGAVVEGHTGEGLSRWSNDFYREKFCAPIHHDWDGPEQVYRFEMAPMLVADVRLDSPCEELDLFAASWPHEGCPDREHRVTACEADVTEGDGGIRLVTQDNPQTWLVAVDGKQAVTAPFELAIECTPR